MKYRLGTKGGELLKVQIKNSKDSEKYFRELFNPETLEIREEFIVLYLNSNNVTVGFFKVSVGGMTNVLVDVRLVMRQALECYATTIIVAHNHPSGSLKPSEADIKITQKIKDACALFDMRLIEHIILTDNSYYSFADEGIL